MTQATDPVAVLVAKVRARGTPPAVDPRTELPEPAERRDIRVRAGVTLQEIADALSVSTTTVWHWENGGDGPSVENAARYRALLDELAKAGNGTCDSCGYRYDAPGHKVACEPEPAQAP